MDHKEVFVESVPWCKTAPNLQEVEKCRVTNLRDAGWKSAVWLICRVQEVLKSAACVRFKKVQGVGTSHSPNFYQLPAPCTFSTSSTPHFFQPPATCTFSTSRTAHLFTPLPAPRRKCTPVCMWEANYLNFYLKCFGCLSGNFWNYTCTQKAYTIT